MSRTITRTKTTTQTRTARDSQGETLYYVEVALGEPQQRPGACIRRLGTLPPAARRRLPGRPSRFRSCQRCHRPHYRLLPPPQPCFAVPRSHSFLPCAPGPAVRAEREVVLPRVPRQDPQRRAAPGGAGAGGAQRLVLAPLVSCWLCIAPAQRWATQGWARATPAGRQPQHGRPPHTALQAAHPRWPSLRFASLPCPAGTA